MAVLSKNLPPGFRFSPTEEELIDFLRLKIARDDEQLDFIRELKYFTYEPWDLPALSGIETKDQDWSFFSPQHLKSRNGNRLNRATRGGYWKVTGKDQEILSGARSIGKKKILVFYEGRTPKGEKTDWVTHEYHLSQEELDGNNPDQTTFVLCRLFKRPNKGSNGRKRMCSGKAGPANSKRIAASLSPSLEVQAEDYPIDECFETEDSDGATSVTTTPAVEFGDNNFIASAAMNQVAEVTNTEVDMQAVETNVWTPFPSSSPEEAESGLIKASVSPASGEEEEGDHNHVTINQVAEPNHISDNAGTITNDQVAEASDSEDSNMSCAPPDIDWSSLSPVHSPRQEVLHPFCNPYLVANDSNCFDGEVPFQYGTNDADDYTSELWGPMTNHPYKSLHNDPSSQKNRAFDTETMENMESVKNNGSHSAPSAEMLNAQKFESSVQDSMLSQEINRKASSGLLTPGSYNGGGFSIRSRF
ncbi:NAC domain-containing protein 43-like [Alnus glutinosa]|uniref:NAC domain-containing protein 43-like n=1 Tax=Alnus glutinosa TaxID=3517 RepID=UPI002D79E43F|nr:NAC domain-containing protein 43-like [Alnus glutinosa]